VQIDQLSIFGIEAHPPQPADLDGLLAGAGQVVRLGGTARVSIVVDAAWRVRVLIGEFTRRGLATSWDKATIEGHFGVRTAYSSRLAPLGSRWLRGAVKRPPKDFFLDGQRLRLWCAAAGAPAEDGGYSLHLGADEECWKPVGTALANAGLPAALLGPRAGGPLFRIEGRKRVAHLAELIGDPPADVPDGHWPHRGRQWAERSGARGQAVPAGDQDSKGGHDEKPGGRTAVSSPQSVTKRVPAADRPAAPTREAAFQDEPGLFDL
jgi:hypothetical protein